MGHLKPLGYICRSYNWENPNVTFDETPFVESLSRNGVLLPPLEIFLELAEHSPREWYEAREIRAICSEHIGALQSGGRGAPESLAVWMDDRSKEGGPRSYNGPMNIGDWLQLLKLKRFGESGKPDAETRRIYLPNPNSWTLGAMVLTATSGQVPVLRNFIRRHLDGEASIKARFPGRFFVLEFHLPFIALRKSAREDRRKKANKTSLRSSQPLSLLFKLHGTEYEEKESMYGQLHDAQVSCVVTGYNNTIWTAWAMADTYFHDDTDSPNNQDMLDYYDDPDEAGDPLSRGEILVHPPLWDPREYFLMILKTRLKQVVEEWRGITYVMKTGVDEYVKNPHIDTLPGRYSLGSAEEKAQAIRNSYKWVRELKGVLAHLIGSISKATAAFDSFEKQDIGYFSEAPGNSTHLLHDVFEIVSDLRDIEAEICNIDGAAEDFKKQLELYLLVEGSCAVVLQQWNVTIIQFSVPPALAAAVIQAEVVQFQPSWAFFLLLTIVIWATMGAMQPVLTYFASSRAGKCKTQSYELQDVNGVSFGRSRDSGWQLQFPRATFSKSISHGISGF